MDMSILMHTTIANPIAPKNTAVIVEPETIVSWDHTKLGGAY